MFPKNAGRHELFQNIFPVTVAGLALAKLSPRVFSPEEFQKRWALVGWSGAARRYKNLSRKVWPPVALGWFSVVQRYCFCEKVPLVSLLTKKVGPANPSVKLSLAPRAWFANKSGKFVRVIQLIGAVFESSNQQLSNACRGHGE